MCRSARGTYTLCRSARGTYFFFFGGVKRLPKASFGVG
jgi:hypothetical protein